MTELARKELVALGNREADATRHVHQVRKILKRLRTGTRVLMGVADAETLRRNRRVFRDAAWLLAPSRDGTVRLRTFNDLVGNDEKKTGGKLAEVRLRLASEAAVGEQLAWEEADEALRLLEGAGIPKRLWGEAGKERIKKSLRRLLKKAQRDYRDVVGGVSREFHELRKRVKDLYYALEALPGDPRGSRKRALSSLNDLEESLGLQNDVFVLESWIKEAGYGLKECPRFWQNAVRYEKKLRKRVIKEGAVLEELGRKARYRKAFLMPGEAARITASTRW